jgi:hypothetical protein
MTASTRFFEIDQLLRSQFCRLRLQRSNQFQRLLLRLLQQSPEAVVVSGRSVPSTFSQPFSHHHRRLR